MTDCDIDILREEDQWPQDTESLVEKTVTHVWAKTPEGAAQARLGEMSVQLSNDAHVQELNRDWRGKDKPTNVLSFAAEEGDDLDFDQMPAEMLAEMPRMLGDIVLAYETVLQEAATQGKEFDHHLTHLVMHGVLHLLGYDHIEEDEAEEMEALETRLLADFNIPDPYENNNVAPDI